jgi:hypothetical protein
MDVRFDSLFLADLLRAEASARGVAGRLVQLAAAREQDGLDEDEALHDAAESLGLVSDVRDALTSAIEPLAEYEVASVLLGSAHGTMPTLRRTDHQAWLSVEPGALGELTPVCDAIVAKMLADPELTAVTLPLGLGGSGGCACGDELPEDQPPGPLFVR